MPEPIPADEFHLDFDTGVLGRLPHKVHDDFIDRVSTALRNCMPDAVRATTVAVVRINPRDDRGISRGGVIDPNDIDVRVVARPVDGHVKVAGYPIEFHLEYWSNDVTSGAIVAQVVGRSGGEVKSVDELEKIKHARFMPPEDRSDSGLPLVRQAWFGRSGAPGTR